MYMYILDKCNLSVMSCTAITSKFKMYWFPNEGCYWTEDVATMHAQHNNNSTTEFKYNRF